MLTAYSQDYGSKAVDNSVENVKKFDAPLFFTGYPNKFDVVILYIWSNNADGYVNCMALRLRFNFIIARGSYQKCWIFIFYKEIKRNEKLVLTNTDSVIIINERCEVRHAEVLE